MPSIKYIQPISSRTIIECLNYGTDADVSVFPIKGACGNVYAEDFEYRLRQQLEVLNMCDPEWAIAGAGNDSLIPRPAQTVDENLLIINNKAKVQFDKQFYSCFFGVDACLRYPGRVYSLNLPVKLGDLHFDMEQAKILKQKHQIRPINTTQRKFRKLAVILQLYYIEQWPEFTGYLNNIKEDYDLYVTIPEIHCSHEEYAALRLKILLFKPDADILRTENNGMDIGQTFKVMKHILSLNISYDFYLKLHSKGSSDKWRKELIEPICGNTAAVINSMNLLKLSQFGMVGCKKWLINVVPGDVCTTNNMHIIRYHMERMNWHDRSIFGNSFIGGTIFWVKGDLWERFFYQVDIDKTYSHFKSGRVSDVETGTHAHSFERLFGFWIKENNQKIIGI